MKSRLAFRGLAVPLASVLLSTLCPMSGVHAQGVTASTPALTIDPNQGDGRVPAFYKWNKALPRKPGEMLARENLEPVLVLREASKAERILYTSTDGVTGQGTVTVSGSVFLPKGTPPEGGWPLIAWAHGTVGMADICAPSLAGRSMRDIDYLDNWLRQGYAIVATDYQGLGTPGPHPYVNTRPEAYSLLDGIRAVQSSYRNLSRKTVLVGQSQGAQAAFAAAGYASRYAPDLDLRGTVATGIPNHLIDELPGHDRDHSKDVSTQPDPTVYYLLYALLMAQQTQPGLDASTVLTEKGLSFFEQARSVCNNRLEADIRSAGLTRTLTFRPGELDAALRPVAERLTYPTFKLAQPVFVGIGGKDGEVAPDAQLKLVADACKAGTIVEAHYYADQSHGGTVNSSQADSSAFVRKVFSGERVSPMCSPRP